MKNRGCPRWLHHNLLLTRPGYHALDIGIDIEGGKICILLYADDIVLIAENENDLQLLLHILNTRCKHKALNVNFEKTKIVHFRNPSVKLLINILNNTGDKTQPFLQPECIEPLSHISIQFNCTFNLRINSFNSIHFFLMIPRSLFAITVTYS
jgi:hypothetical protein